MNCDPFYITDFVSMLKFLTQCSRKILAAAVKVVFIVGIPVIHSEIRSVIRKMYWLPLFRLDRGTRMSMVIDSCASVARKAVLSVVNF